MVSRIPRRRWEFPPFFAHRPPRPRLRHPFHLGRPNGAAIARRRPALRRRHTLTDRDQVDDVPCQASTAAAAIVPHRKNADGRPLAGSIRSAKDLWHPAARRPIRVRPSRAHRCFLIWKQRNPQETIIQFGRLFRTLYAREACAVTSVRGPDGSCRRPEILGSAVAAGEGTGLKFLPGKHTGRTGRMPAEARIHLIAIGRSRPWWEGGASARTGHAQMRESCALSASGTLRYACGGSPAGRTRVKVVPAPSVDCTCTSPPCAAAIPCTMLSPRPMPRRSAVLACQ